MARGQMIAATEAAEPDDLLPVSLPLDDVARIACSGYTMRVGAWWAKSAWWMARGIARSTPTTAQTAW